jgi:excinuclease ABC subunit C
MRPTDKPKDIPTNPGVYRFRDESQRVIYVGKANNLRNRLANYFGKDLHPRTQSMVDSARSVDWVIVRNETEALQLEYSWIKEFDPVFNVRYRDDKTYPYLAISTSEEFPRALYALKYIEYEFPLVKPLIINERLANSL